jgi:hypothetical protein
MILSSLDIRRSVLPCRGFGKHNSGWCRRCRFFQFAWIHPYWIDIKRLSPACGRQNIQNGYLSWRIFMLPGVSIGNRKGAVDWKERCEATPIKCDSLQINLGETS